MEDHDFDLGQQIAELRGITVKGFEGVNSHLAELNGKVARNVKEIYALQISQATKDGEKKGMSLSWGVFIAIAGIVIGTVTAIFTYLQIKK